ncbi:MAG TPA: S53 family peptidase [Gaiellaceae bacterium]|nr:S53 family peptidase [Gaiellaceae bacterium]
MPSKRLRRVVAAVAGALTLATLVVTAGASARTNGPFDSGRHVLPGSKPAWTVAAPQTAAVPSGQAVHARVWLTPRNSDQLDALAQAVSDPSNAQFGQFITADQYDAQFAPTFAQVGQVTQWLTQSGLSVVATGPDNHYVEVAGSAAAAAAAFGAPLADYLVNGTQAQAPTADLSVPDSLGQLVTTVTGLSTFGHAMKPADFGAEPAFVNATPCSDYYGQQTARTLPKFQNQTLPYAVCGYTPDQLRGAYGVGGRGNGDNLGRGQTVAITDAYDSPRLLSDANTYAVRHGDRPFAPGQFQDRSVPENAATGDDCGGNGWYGEQTLDVEAVHAMAPGANVLYYGAASCFDDDLLAQLSQIVHDNKASIVTNSWGSPTFSVDPTTGNLVQIEDPATIAAYESVFKQGAVQGIGFMFSSGDNGDELDNTGYAAPDYPASDPWVTAVGGTALAVDRRDNRMFETGWGTARYGLTSDGSAWTLTFPFLYGAGGGISGIFPEPAYQRGVAGRLAGRGVPDVAMDGDPTTGMLIGETQDFSLPSRFGPPGVHYGEYRVGGTSLSSPLFAGAEAVAQANEGGRRIGFANPLVYFLARVPGEFYDVTPQGDPGNIRSDFINGENADGGLRYTVRTFDQDSSLTTNRGWDEVTGVGSLTSRYFDWLSDLRR